MHAGLVDAFITAGGILTAADASVPVSGSNVARDSAARGSAEHNGDSRAARGVDASTGAVSSTAAEHSLAGSSAGVDSAAPDGIAHSNGTLNPKRPAFLLDEALRSMSGGNFAAARARLALCRTALLAQAVASATSDPSPESALSPVDIAAERGEPGGRCTAEAGSAQLAGHRSERALGDRTSGSATPAARATGGSTAEAQGSGRGDADGRGGGGGVEPGVGVGRDALACQLGAVCGSLVRPFRFRGRSTWAAHVFVSVHMCSTLGAVTWRKRFYTCFTGCVRKSTSLQCCSMLLLGDAKQQCAVVDQLRVGRGAVRRKLAADRSTALGHPGISCNQQRCAAWRSRRPASYEPQRCQGSVGA